MRGHGIPGEAANDVPPTNGGQAFPRAGSQNASSVAGMTLRDYFAGQALVGLLSDSSRCGDTNDYTRDAWAYADSMLKERAK